MRQEIRLSGELSLAPEPGETINSTFVVSLRHGDDPDLRVAYEPLTKNLQSTDYGVRVEALHVINQMAPPFLEETILHLAHPAARPEPTRVVEALEKLNTARTREALAALAEQSEFEGERQQAIFALGRLGDRAYLPLLQKLAGRKERYLQHAAIRAAGELGRESAVGFLVPLLRSTDPLIRHDAVFGLANTGSRQVVSFLIEMLQDGEELVRQSAANALWQLTHRSAELDVRDQAQAAQARQRWLRWWALNHGTVEVFGPRECGTFKSLE
jgi:HEAT repeat protein